MNIFQRKRILIEANHKIALEVTKLQEEKLWYGEQVTRLRSENATLKKQLQEQEKTLNIRIIS